MLREQKRSHWLLLPVFILFGFAGISSAETRPLTLNGFTIAIDEQTGSIVQMSYPEVGVILRASPEKAGLLDVAYPVEAFAPMRLASRFSNARVVKDGIDFIISWDRLGPSRGNVPMPSGNVSAQVKLRSAPDGRSIIMSCRIENHSAAPIPQVMFPDLWGLQPFEGLKETQLRLPRGVVQPFMEPIRPLDSASFYVGRGWKDYPPTGYYGLNALRWMDYGGLRGGLSIFQKRWATPDRPGIWTQRTEANPDNLRLMFEHKAAIAPSQTWESGEFWLTPHRGGWAKGIEVFREYVTQVNPPRPLPGHVRDGIGFQTIWMIQNAEMDPAKAAFKYTDLPRVAQDSKEHGLDELVPWGWCNSFTMPIPLRGELGTLQEFLAGIRKAKEIGVNIAPFISIQIVHNQFALHYNVPPATSDWTYHPDLIPNFRPFYTKFWDGASVDSENKIWQQDMKAALTQWITRGLESFCWDVFSTDVKQDGTSELIQLIQQIRDLARGKDSESTFSAESVQPTLELDTKVLDYTWNWIDYVDAGPILSVLRTPRLNCNVEESALVVKKAFCDGLYLNVMPTKPDQPNGTALVSEVPQLSAALKQIEALHKQFLPYFVDGIFIGDSVLSAPAPVFVRGRLLGNKLLISVLNDGKEARNVSIQSSLDLWLPRSQKYQIHYYHERKREMDGMTVQDPRWHGVTRLLQPLELAFFEIEALP